MLFEKTYFAMHNLLIEGQMIETFPSPASNLLDHIPTRVIKRIKIPDNTINISLFMNVNLSYLKLALFYKLDGGGLLLIIKLVVGFQNMSNWLKYN